MHSDTASVASVGSVMAPVIDPKEWARQRKEMMLRAATRRAEGLPPLSATYRDALSTYSQRSRATTVPHEPIKVIQYLFSVVNLPLVI